MLHLQLTDPLIPILKRKYHGIPKAVKNDERPKQINKDNILFFYVRILLLCANKIGKFPMKNVHECTCMYKPTWIIDFIYIMTNLWKFVFVTCKITDVQYTYVSMKIMCSISCLNKYENFCDTYKIEIYFATDGWL